MFTGLVAETGELLQMQRTATGARLIVRGNKTTSQSAIGDSIAVNGCCLTVTEKLGPEVTFDLLAETLERTNLGQLQQGAIVNLEAALSASAKLGGHFVQGHIDTTATILSFQPSGSDYRLEVELPGAVAAYVAFKGSIAIDGISLTVAEVSEERFVCWIIPHTFQSTNLRTRKSGDLVNLECDILAKYVERILTVKK